MAQTKKTKHQDVPAGAIAAGVLAAGAAAAAGYYFYGAKHATQHRKTAVKWAHDLKRDVAREAKRLEGLGEDVMHDAVDRVANSYAKQSGVDPKQLSEAVSELKKNWRRLRNETLGKKKTVAKKTAKKTAKKN